MRIGEFSRKTGETDITVKINLDGTGRYTLESGVPFFDHMLTMLAKHGLMNLEIACKRATRRWTTTTPSRTWGLLLGRR